MTAAGPIQAGEIYKSIDPQGNVVYSDHLDPSMSQSTVVQLDSALNTLPGNNAERDSTTAANLDLSSGGTVSSPAAPPPIPDAGDQPTLYQDGALWTPGYWYWRDRAYVWIPGAWVRPPQVGFLWTPAYWASNGAGYVFHPGHWGSTVGFYGGVNYGHGYSGYGYTGGHWSGNSFVYNNAVNHVAPAVAVHTLSRHPSPERIVTQPTSKATVERRSETSPMPMKITSSATAAKASAHTATRAAPVKR